MSIAEVNAEITYQPLTVHDAQAAHAIEAELIRRDPALVEEGVILPKGESGYVKVLSDEHYTFWGAFQDRQLIGFQGCHYVDLYAPGDLRSLIGEQFVSCYDEVAGHRISETPLPLPRLSTNADGPMAMLITLRLHPDHHRKRSTWPSNVPKQPSIGTVLNTTLMQGAMDSGASHVMVDMALKNRAVFEIQRNSAREVGLTLWLFGAAHDVSGGSLTPSITVVLTKEPHPTRITPVNVMPIDSILKEINSGLGHIRFLKLSALLNGGYVGIPNESHFHFAERPSFFSPAENKWTILEAACLGLR